MKRIFTLIFIICTIGCLSSCSNNSMPDTKTKKSEKVAATISPSPSPQNTMPQEVLQGELMTTQNAELYIDYSNISTKILPPQPSRVYSYYTAENGKTYIDVCFAYKNLSADEVEADNVISAQLKYADKYSYSGFTIIEEDNRSDFTYTGLTSISPLSTEYIHYLFEVPEEVGESQESICVNFSAGGSQYTYTIR